MWWSRGGTGEIVCLSTNVNTTLDAYIYQDIPPSPPPIIRTPGINILSLAPSIPLLPIANHESCPSSEMLEGAVGGGVDGGGISGQLGVKMVVASYAVDCSAITKSCMHWVLRSLQEQVRVRSEG